jgi:hypothetical protein
MTGQLNIGAGAAGVIHVLFAGIRFDLPLAGLEIDLASDDYLVKRALARHLKVPVGRFDDYVVEREADGNLTIRLELFVS